MMWCNKDKEDWREIWSKSIFGRIGCSERTFVIFSLFFLLLMFLFSCAAKTKIEYVDKEVVKFVTQKEYDTLVVNTHDSVFYSIVQKADTVYITKYLERTKFKDRIVNKIDTCFLENNKVQIKENTTVKTKVPKWCYYCLAFCSFCFIFASIKIILWLKRYLAAT